MAKDRTLINVLGESNFQYRELTSGGAGTTWSNGGYLKTTSLKDDVQMVEIIDEHGDLVNVLPGVQKCSIDVVLMQSDAATINILRNKGSKYYEFYFKKTLANGYIQEINGFGKIIPKVDVNFAAGQERNIPCTLVFLKPTAVYTRTTYTYFSNSASDGPYPYLLIENATAQGAPADTVGTVYTYVM